MDGGELFSRIEESQGFSERGVNQTKTQMQNSTNLRIIKLKHQMPLKSQRANPNAQFDHPAIRSSINIIKAPRLEEVTFYGSLDQSPTFSFRRCRNSEGDLQRSEVFARAKHCAQRSQAGKPPLFQ